MLFCHRRRRPRLTDATGVFSRWLSIVCGILETRFKHSRTEERCSQRGWIQVNSVNLENNLTERRKSVNVSSGVLVRYFETILSCGMSFIDNFVSRSISFHEKSFCFFFNDQFFPKALALSQTSVRSDGGGVRTPRTLPLDPPLVTGGLKLSGGLLMSDWSARQLHS